MEAIITGDIINSRKVEVDLWMPKLKEELSKVGIEPKDWEIYRGDSFQVKTSPKNALEVAIKLKASIKQFKLLDIRMAIGIGSISYLSEKITESNGEAFINSGECFESLKKKRLAINSPWVELDASINLMLEIMGLTIDSWSENSAFLIKKNLDNPNTTQKELASLLNKKQSNISSGLKRAGYDEVYKLINYYQNQISKLC